MSGKGGTNEDRIFTADFALMFAGNLIIVSIYFLLMTTMALYAITVHGADSATGGVAASIFLVGGVLGRILSSRYVDWFGARRMTIAALVLQLVCCGLYFEDALGMGFLIGLRFVHGLSFGIANTTIPAMAVDGLPRKRLGEGTGYFMLSNSLGVGVGPLMSILLVMGIEYKVLFIICTVAAAIAILTTLLSSAGKSFKEGVRPGKFTVSSIIDPSTLKISIFMFFVALSYSSLNSFVTVYATDQGWAQFGPMVFLVYSVVLLISRPITGKMLDRFGDNSVLYPSILCAAIGVALAATAFNPIMLLCCGIFMALGFGTCMSCGQAVATRLAGSKKTTIAISTFFLLTDGGCGLGPVFLGFAAEAWGYRAMYWICALLALIGIVFYHFAHGRKPEAKAVAQDNS